MRALISVYNKDGIVEFATKLHELGVEIISTGGTGKLFEANNIPFIPVEKITKNKEAFGGRMKTISFEMMSSILFRRNNENDQLERKELGLEPIDLVVCNLYDFDSAIKNNGDIEQMVELIDVGGPTMIRASAKNFNDVTCVVDPMDYQTIADEILQMGFVSFEKRKELAIKAFRMTANYDLMIATELSKKLTNEVDLCFSNVSHTLRYGENPHQKAKIFLLNNTNQKNTLANAPILHGKEISYNNYLDSDSAFKCVSELATIFPDKKSVVIVKHGIPCGVATSESLFQSLSTAWNTDSTSAFGGVIAMSSEVDLKTAEFFDDKFIEIIMAPSFSVEALLKLKEKKNVRILRLDTLDATHVEKTVRSINGGILVQDEDLVLANSINFKLQTKAGFDSVSEKLLMFGQTVVKYLKSNCLVLVNESNNVFKITASGVGQPNRVECLTKLISAKISDQDISNNVLFSDAFFPFSDSIDAANSYGIKYIVQPGGSIKDKDVMARCNELNIAMKFTNTRNFRH